MDRFDVMMVLGGVLVAVGVGLLLSVPGGMIVAGVELIGLGVIGARAQARKAS